MGRTDAITAAAGARTPTGTPVGAATGPQGSTPTDAPVPVAGSDVLSDLALQWGLQERAGATAALLVLSLLVAKFVVPWLVGRGRRTYRSRVQPGQVQGLLEEVEDVVPFGMTTYYVVRLLQFTLVAVAGLVVLVVWGLTGIAIDAVRVFLGVVPQLVRTMFSVALIVAAYVGVDVLEAFVDRVAKQSDRLDEHQGEIVFRVLQVVLLTSAGLVVLGIWDVNLGGLLVGAGFLGIVVGMAARQTLGSLLAGFVLMFSKPFEVGDWVEIDEQEGVVTDITIVNTRLENFDGEYVVMPNDVISNSTIVNRTRKGRLRVRMDVGVDYDVDPEHARAVAKDAITELEDVMSVPRPEVVPTGFGDSAILLECRFWIDKPSSRRRWRAKASVIQAVYEAFDEEDIAIPFPQRTLSGRSGTGEFSVAGEAPPEQERPGAAED